MKKTEDNHDDLLTVNKFFVILFKVNETMQSNIYLTAIRHGFSYTMPFLLLSAFTYVFDGIVADLISNFVPNFNKSAIVILTENLRNAVMKTIPIIIIFGITFSLINSQKTFLTSYLSYMSLIGIILIFTCYFYVFLNTKDDNHTFIFMDINNPFFIFSLTFLIIIPFILLSKYIYKLSHARQRSYDHVYETNYLNVLELTIPFVVVLFSFFIIIAVLESSLLKFDLSAMTLNTVNLIKDSSAYFIFIFIDFLRNSLFFFGIHRLELYDYLFNQATFIHQTKVDMSNLNIVEAYYRNNFLYLGGAGATLGLIMASLVLGKKNHYSYMIKISLVPSLFNINEILIFGLPIIFNFVFLIPFLITPTIIALVDLLIFSFYPIKTQVADLDWAIPIFISGFIATGNFKGAILQLINLIIATAIYYPFVKASFHQEKYIYLKEKNNILEESLTRLQTENYYYTFRDDMTGSLARYFSLKIKKSLAKDEIGLKYDPVFDMQEKNIFALKVYLKWHHKIHIPSRILTTIAQEVGYIKNILLWEIENVVRQMQVWHNTGHEIPVILRIEAIDIANYDIATILIDTLKSKYIDPKYLYLEIKESMELSTSPSFKTAIDELKDFGVKCIIEEFSFSHSVADYMNNLDIYGLEVYYPLVKHISQDNQSRIIFDNIIKFCNKLNMILICDNVKDKDYYLVLKSMKQRYMQGSYFYSKEFLTDNNGILPWNDKTKVFLLENYMHLRHNT